MATVPRVAEADTLVEAIEAAKELESQLKDFPERGLSYSKFLIPLFSSPSSSIRSSSFGAALQVLSNHPNAASQLITAYENAISDPDSEVAKHALTYLPQFVKLSKANAKQLISAAVRTTQNRAGFSNSSRYIAEAMNIVKHVDRV